MAVSNEPYEKQIKVLLASYKMAQNAITSQIKEALHSGNLNRASERQRQFLIVTSLLNQLGTGTDSLARNAIAQAYGRSANTTATDLAKKLGQASFIPPDQTAFNSVAREAVFELSESMVGRLTNARATIGRQVRDVFASVGRREVMLGLLGASGSGRKVSQGMLESLRAQGKTAFIDRGGRRWSLENYAEMAARTTTREAVTQGAVDRMAAQGVSLLQISRHASSCSVCKPFEGQVMSLDGRTGLVDGVSVSALRLPPFHPFCAHSVSPFIPALAEAT